MSELTWSECTFLSWENAKGTCQVCGKHIYLLAVGDERLVGHHILNRAQNGPNTVENNAPRHFSCEFLAHQLETHGNPKSTQVSWQQQLKEIQDG